MNIRRGMRVVAGLALLAMLGAVCGCRAGGESAQGEGASITYTSAGGIVGGLETIEIKGDGAILITRSGKTSGEEALKVSPDRVTELVDELEKARFFEMAKKYAPSRPVPDMMSERLDYRDATRSKSVTVITGSEAPEGWARVVKAVRSLVSNVKPTSL